MEQNDPWWTLWRPVEAQHQLRCHECDPGLSASPASHASGLETTDAIEAESTGIVCPRTGRCVSTSQLFAFNQAP